MAARPRVLIADDDPELLQSVAMVVERMGAEVVCASNGQELIEQLAEAPFSLVVTDVSMPWMSGLQAMHSVRYAGLGTPIIVMTGLRDAQLPAHVAALGPGVVLLRKPFEAFQLEEAVRQLWAQSASPTSGPASP
ncbi:MAG: response regulator [Polyangiales bacterium]